MVKHLTATTLHLFLVLSLLFTFPLVIAQPAYAETVTREQAAAQFCGPINVRESLVLSVVTLCLGGVLDKMEEWRQIKCRAVVCHYESVKFGLDPQFCEDQENFLTCSYIVGDVFAIPPLSTLEYFRQGVANLLANPVGTLWGVGVKVARSNLLACSSTSSCSIRVHGAQALFLAVTDTAGVIQMILDIFENGFSGMFGGSNNACEQVEDIKVEMEEILGIVSEE